MTNIFNRLRGRYHHARPAPHGQKPIHCGRPPHCGTPHCHCGGGFWEEAETFAERLARLADEVVGEAEKTVASVVKPVIKEIFKGLFGIKHEIEEFEDSPFDILSENRALRVAFVGPYGTPCGISTYNEELIGELGLRASVRVFADYADEARSRQIEGDQTFVVRCWDRFEHPRRDLIAEIVAYQPDIVHISHEYGYWPKAYFFSSFVSALRGRGMKVVATMHSVYEHLDKTVQEACPDHLMVHSQEGKVCMVKKGLDPDRITVIPHGSSIFAGTPGTPELLPSLWNTWGSEHTLYQPGFLFGYKGHMRMLGVVAKLKEKYPDIHYIVQGSLNPNTMGEHDELYASLVAKCQELGVEGNVTLNTGFVSREVLMDFIRTVKCVVLPYQQHPDHEVRATSGIARLVMATETPLVVTNVHLFDDLEGVVPRAESDEALAAHIDRIFSDWKAKDEQLVARRAFLRATSWSAVAQKVVAWYSSVH